MALEDSKVEVTKHEGLQLSMACMDQLHSKLNGKSKFEEADSDCESFVSQIEDEPDFFIMLDPKVTEDSKHRCYVVSEIISSERLYIRCLTALSEGFVKAVQDNPRYSGDPRFTIWFHYINQIKKINATFLGNMEVQSFDKCVGQVFLNHIPMLKLYIQYSRVLGDALDALRYLRKNDQSVCRFLASIEKTDTLNGQCIESLAIMPIQRVPRYILLLKQIVRYTVFDHVDLLFLKDALSQLGQLADLMSSGVNKSREHRILTVVDADLSFRRKQDHTEIVKMGRKLVKDGTLVRLTRKGKRKSVYLHVFNDFFVMSNLQRFRFGIRSKFKAKIAFSIDKVSCTSNQMQEEDSGFAFEIETPLRCFTVFATSKESRMEWIQIINNYSQEYSSLQKSLQNDVSSVTPKSDMPVGFDDTTKEYNERPTQSNVPVGQLKTETEMEKNNNYIVLNRLSVFQTESSPSTAPVSSSQYDTPRTNLDMICDELYASEERFHLSLKLLLECTLEKHENPNVQAKIKQFRNCLLEMESFHRDVLADLRVLSLENASEEKAETLVSLFGRIVKFIRIYEQFAECAKYVTIDLSHHYLMNCDSIKSAVDDVIKLVSIPMRKASAYMRYLSKLSQQIPRNVHIKRYLIDLVFILKKIRSAWENSKCYKFVDYVEMKLQDVLPEKESLGMLVRDGMLRMHHHNGRENAVVNVWLLLWKNSVMMFPQTADKRFSVRSSIFIPLTQSGCIDPVAYPAKENPDVTLQFVEYFGHEKTRIIRLQCVDSVSRDSWFQSFDKTIRLAYRAEQVNRMRKSRRSGLVKVIHLKSSLSTE